MTGTQEYDTSPHVMHQFELDKDRWREISFPNGQFKLEGLNKRKLATVTNVTSNGQFSTHHLALEEFELTESSSRKRENNLT